MSIRPPSPPHDPARLLGEQAEELRRLARGLLRDAEAAEDVAQEAQVRSLGRRGLARPMGWLATVVRHLAYRRARDATRRRRREVRAARPEALASTEELAQRRELRARLLAAVAALPEPYRSAIEQRYFDGARPAAMARASGEPLATVKARLHRGLARLRAELHTTFGRGRSSWVLPLSALAYPSGRFGASAVLGALQALLGGIAMNKFAVVGALALLSLAGWTALRARGPEERARPTPTPSGRLAPQPVLEGTPRAPGAAAENRSSSSGRLLAHDPVPEHTFAGRVVGPDGQGVAGAEVALVWVAAHSNGKEAANGVHLVLRREGERREAPSTHADGDGYFRLDRPYGSQSYLRARAPGFDVAISGPHESGSFALLTLSANAARRVLVRTAEGRAVAGAEVRLVVRSIAGGIPTLARQVLNQARTDAEGVARLTWGEHRGWVHLEVAPAEADFSFVEQPLPESAVDEVHVVVPKVERVSEHRVLDATTGQAVPGAFVVVLRESNVMRWSDESARRTFVADAQGLVRVPWQEGLASAFAGAPGYEVASAHGDPIRLARAMRLTGVVLDEAGRPLAGAAICLAISGGVAVFDAVYAGQSPVAGWTDEQGRFDVAVALGRPLVGATPPDRGVRTVLALHPEHTPALQDDVAVVAGTSRELLLRVQASATLALSIVDATDRPLEGQWVQAARLIARAPTWPALSRDFGLDVLALLHPGVGAGAQTDATGRLTLRGLPAGPYLIRSDTTETRITLESGQVAAVRMVKGAGPSIGVRVLDADGRPVSRHVVSLSGPQASAASTAQDGRVVFRDLVPGNYQVGVLLPGLVQAFSKEASPGQDVELRLPAGPARLLIQVEGPAHEDVEASLTTAPGGAWPLETGFVRLPPPGTPTEPFTPGTGVLVLRAKNFGWTAVPFVAAAATTTTLSVRLPRAGALRGRLEGIEGAGPGDGLLVRCELEGVGWAEIDALPRGAYAVQRSRGDRQEFATVGADGRFEMHELRPGEYAVSAGRHDEAGTWVGVAQTRVSIRSDETQETVLRP